MKINLSIKEIEMILNLYSDIASKDYSVGNTGSYSLDEILLISKLEDAIKDSTISQIVPEIPTNSLQH